MGCCSLGGDVFINLELKGKEDRCLNCFLNMFRIKCFQLLQTKDSFYKTFTKSELLN